MLTVPRVERRLQEIGPTLEPQLSRNLGKPVDSQHRHGLPTSTTTCPGNIDVARIAGVRSPSGRLLPTPPWRRC